MVKNRRIPILTVLAAASVFGSVLEAGAVDPCRAPVRNAATRFWIPLVGHGTDAFGNRIDTVFKMINLQETTASFTIRSCSDSGVTSGLLAGAAGPVSRLDMTIPGRGTRTINSLNADPANALSVGWAQVETPSAIGVEVIFNLRDRSGFLTSTNVRVGVITSATSFFAEIGPAVNTGVAFLYPPEENAPERIDIDLVLRDERGVQVGQTSISLNKSQKTARFLGELLTPAGQSWERFRAGSSPAFSGSVDVRVRPADTAARLAILPLRQEGLVLTTQVLFPARETAAAGSGGSLVSPSGANLCRAEAPANQRVFYVPLIGHGVDSFGNRLDTVFKLINLAGQPANARIVACSDSGQMADLLASDTGPTSLIDFAVDGNGAATLRSLNRNPESALDVGWAVVTSPDFVGLEVIFNLRDQTGFLTSTNVQTNPIVTAVSFFADIGPAVNTGTAFMYPNFNDGSEQRASIDLFLLNRDGTTVAQTSVGLDKGEKTARFLGELVTPSGLTLDEFLRGTGESFSGSVEIRASEPVAILPLRQEGLVLTTQALFPPRAIR